MIDETLESSVSFHVVPSMTVTFTVPALPEGLMEPVNDEVPAEVLASVMLSFEELPTMIFPSRV